MPKNVYLLGKCREILIGFRQKFGKAVLSPHTQKLTNGLYLFFVVDGRVQCRTGRIHIRLIWQDSDSSLVF